MIKIGYSYVKNNINFQGINCSPREVKNMDKVLKESLAKALSELNKNIEGKFPEYGEFNVVYETFKNPDKSSIVTDYMLKITKPSKEIEGHEKIRNLEMVAYRLPSTYVAERLLATGTKKEIISEIQKPELLEKLLKAAKSLEQSLSDM